MKVYAQLVTTACRQVGVLLCPLESEAVSSSFPPTPSGAAFFTSSF